MTGITGVKSITKSTSNWKAPIGARSRREPFHSLVSSPPWSPGKEAHAKRAGCSAQASRGTLGAPCLHVPRGPDRANTSQQTRLLQYKSCCKSVTQTEHSPNKSKAEETLKDIWHILKYQTNSVLRPVLEQQW